MSLLDHSRLHTGVWWFLLLLSATMVLFNVGLRSWGIGTFASFDQYIIRLAEADFYVNTPYVDADGSPSALRYGRSPAGRWLHILPTGLWSVIAPFQLSPTFRSRHYTAHRRLGRVFIGLSVSMALGIPPLIWSGASRLHLGVWQDVVMIMLAGYFLLTAVLATQHARSKRIASHRVWILRHVAMGYSAHLQRVIGPLVFEPVSYFAPTFNQHSEQGAYVRDVVFVGSFWLAIAICVTSMEIWLRHTSLAPAARKKTKAA